MPEIITGQDAAASYEAGGGAEEAARVDAARGELLDEATGGQDREGLILGKYRSAEDLASAYQSLQREYTRLKSGQPVEPLTDQGEAPVAPGESEPEPEGEAPIEGDGPPPISPEAAARIQRAIFDQAGGEAEYQRLAGWASKALPAERVEAYNRALSAGEEGAILNALKGLQYDYMMQNGYEPRLVGGRAASDVRGFESEAQVVAAMKDPRYSGDNPDPAYIREVERRIAVSNVFQTR